MHTHTLPTHTLTASYWLLIATLAGTGPARAEIDCSTHANRLASHSTLNLRIDNDLFGGMEQDQGYSNGFLLSQVSPNLLDYLDDPCIPRAVRKLNRYLTWLQPAGYDELNMMIGLGQLMFTPTDNAPSRLLTDDRPYAGTLMLSIGYNARKGDHLRSSVIRIGMVGPSAHARQTQNWWHDIIDVERFNGWDNQLHDEPVLQLIHERRKRLRRQAPSDGWGWDLTRHVGGSLGNFATYANAGGEWRVGFRLPDDFGTAPLRPGGENTSPVIALPEGRWSGHFFVAVDARWMLRDITLDGNTFHSSHRVDKRPFVADIGYGLAVNRGSWRLAFARYHRSREFDGQIEVPVYGTLTLGKRF